MPKSKRRTEEPPEPPRKGIYQLVSRDWATKEIAKRIKRQYEEDFRVENRAITESGVWGLEGGRRTLLKCD